MHLNAINQLKKQLTFGNIPPFYHAVATSIAQADGMLKYGFDSNLDTLLDKSNWNLSYLGGRKSNVGEIFCEAMPRLSVYKLFTREGFEVHCIPWIRDKEFDYELRDRPEMDFIEWEPARMKVVLKIAKLHVFIHEYFKTGDQADLELIKFTHNLIEEFTEHLQSKLNVQKVHGISVKGFYDFAEKRIKAHEDVYLPKVYDFSD